MNAADARVIDYGQYLPPDLHETLTRAAADARQATDLAIRATRKELPPGTPYREQVQHRLTLRNDQAVAAAYQAQAVEFAMQAIGEKLAGLYMEKLNELRDLHAALDAVTAKPVFGRTPTTKPPQPEAWPYEAITRDKRTQVHIRKMDIVHELDDYLKTFGLAHDYKLPVTVAEDGSFAPLN